MQLQELGSAASSLVSKTWIRVWTTIGRGGGDDASSPFRQRQLSYRDVGSA